MRGVSQIEVYEALKGKIGDLKKRAKKKPLLDFGGIYNFVGNHCCRNNQFVFEN